MIEKEEEEEKKLGVGFESFGSFKQLEQESSKKLNRKSIVFSDKLIKKLKQQKEQQEKESDRKTILESVEENEDAHEDDHAKLSQSSDSFKQ